MKITSADAMNLPPIKLTRVARGQVYTSAGRSLVVLHVVGRHAECAAVGYGRARMTRVQVTRLQREYDLAGAIETKAARQRLAKDLHNREIATAETLVRSVRAQATSDARRITKKHLTPPITPAKVASAIDEATSLGGTR